MKRAARYVIPLAAIAAAGIDEPADAGDLMKLLDSFPASLMASMAHDLLAGKPIELEVPIYLTTKLIAEVETPTAYWIPAAWTPRPGARMT